LKLVIMQQKMVHQAETQKKLEASQQKAYMVTKQSKNHQFQAIKKAVDANELTVDQANEIIIKQKKEDNEKVVTTARASKDNFTRVFS
jgi:hypothetical protein